MLDLSFYNKKKVFVTGVTGFKGAYLAHFLLKLGADVSGFALEPETPSLFSQTALEKKLNLVIGDVRDYSSLFKAISAARPELVFHLAAQPLVRRSYREPRLTYETNVMGTVNVLEALRNCGLGGAPCSFVNVTTDKVYENREWHWGYRENENLCGFDPYSNSKSCSELVTSSYRNSFFGVAGAANLPKTVSATPVSTARSGNVIGGGDYAEDRIIPDCVRAVRAGKKITVRNPNSTRPWQHVLDCVSGYLILAQKQHNDPSLAGAWNFGPNDDSCVTTAELVSLFCEIWNTGNKKECAEREAQNQAELSSLELSSKELQPHEARFLKLDCSKSKSLLGWKPRWTLRETIEKTVEFERGAAACVTIEKQIKEYCYEF